MTLLFSLELLIYLIPSLEQWVKDPSMYLCHRWQLWLRFDAWPGNFLYAIGSEENEKKREEGIDNLNRLITRSEIEYVII